VESKGEPDKALADFEEAIRLDPKDAYAYSSRGNSRTMKRQFDKAIADFDEAIRLGLKIAFVYHMRGYSWQQKGDQAKAIADLDEAIRLDPNSPRRSTIVASRGRPRGRPLRRPPISSTRHDSTELRHPKMSPPIRSRRIASSINRS